MLILICFVLLILRRRSLFESAYVVTAIPAIIVLGCYLIFCFYFIWLLLEEVRQQWNNPEYFITNKRQRKHRLNSVKGFLTVLGTISILNGVFIASLILFGIILDLLEEGQIQQAQKVSLILLIVSVATMVLLATLSFSCNSYLQYVSV